ncbi:four helix bundle protein [Algoriphagus halophytocola]|uniref:Four helix bundle protein n=1 Tax=Algoriphagus halophytocola TaxID=2991499 RepID=A0ABY6MLD5_9BACT|nr:MULTISPECIES: four helix bundle protein [unclassified Algoriphagus]UZD23950.1 four helix bundle protein [Algoriphagus sp. TR-M5]WBL41321.1 four helix bundle protein [Algoriphagus sp. TR-M9]
MQSYKDLEVYRKAFKLFVETHTFSLELPKYELYELGSQLRRSADSIISNIVEGYGRRVYKADFIKFLVYSHASNLETINHLEKIQMLYPGLENKAKSLAREYDILGAQIFKFIEFVKRDWRT